MRNFAVDVVERAPPDRLALVALARDGARSEWSFGAVARAARTLAAHLHDLGVRCGDTVLTLVGNQPDWVAALVACFRQGYVALPCNEQLRAKDLRLRLAICPPAALVCDGRNERVLTDAGWSGPTIFVPGVADWRPRDPPPPAALSPLDPCLITFTSGTAGQPKAVVHGQRYLAGQRVQAEHWLAPQPNELVWCTAASGWSKSARNAFVAPWIRGAAALLHDARFDPAERLDVLARENVNVLCMAPTEYRVIAKRATLRPVPSLRGLVAAGGAQSRGAARLARGDGLADPRRLRPDGDRPADRDAAGPGGPARLDGPAAAGDRRGDRRRRARRGSRDGADLLSGLRGRRAARRRRRGRRALAHRRSRAP